MSKIYKLMLGVLLFASMMFAQTYTVSGVVTDANNGGTLIGANVYLKGTIYGAASEAQGKYEFTAPKGKYKLVCSYIGYETIEYDINLNQNMQVDFELEDYEFSLSVEVIANRAKERETPVAFSDISKKEMEFQLGSRDIPMVLNTTPSVYATMQGGGAGDARVNVRGFSQSNVAVMINGVPMNDMENGWVYWSNWDGLGDATSSVQVQRGLSSVNLATPSIGGTMNVITDPTQQRASVFVKSEIGSGAFAKTSVFAHTGLINDKFALSMGVVRKTGEGMIEKTWTDAWAYYMGAAYQINKTNRLELYAMGAPQRHGQRRWKLNAANFSHELARDLGYSEQILKDPKFQEQGVLYNSNWNGIPSEYEDQQYSQMYWNNDMHLRHDEAFLNESENYYHKPLVNLNWYTQFSDKVSLYTTAYWSGGKGGGSGTYGSMGWDYSLQQRVVDFGSTLGRNQSNTELLDFNGDGDSTSYKISRGILRNSVNQQWTIGAISKAYYKVSEEFTGSFGIDWRHAEIDHYREVRDLLGGNYFQEYSDNNIFDSGLAEYKYLGDRIDYNNTNVVDWIGGYLQGEYGTNRWTLYGTAGYSMIKYSYTDHFRAMNDDPAQGELQLNPDWIGGYQLKGGASYRLTPQVDVYANAGYVSKVPIFDQVISDVDAKMVDNPQNEKFISGELGINSKLMNNKLSLKLNAYYTKWTDRSDNVLVQNADGSEGLVRLSGITSTHMGVELEAAFQPVRYFRMDAGASVGNWEYNNDVSGQYIIDFATGQSQTYNYYLSGIKVGDAPQTQVSVGATVLPTDGLQVQLVWMFNANYYSDYDPFSRNDPNDKAQVWQIPDFHLFELHMNYDLPTDIMGMEVAVFAHVFNLFNNLYVQDATDNSAYNAYTANGKNHSADDAEIYPGIPRYFNAGLSVRF